MNEFSFKTSLGILFKAKKQIDSALEGEYDPNRDEELKEIAKGAKVSILVIKKGRVKLYGVRGVNNG